MVTRPLPHLDVWDPGFAAGCRAWTNQIRSEILETVALTRRTIAESKALIEEADRVLAAGESVLLGLRAGGDGGLRPRASEQKPRQHSQGTLGLGRRA